LGDDLEWKIIYVGSAESEEHDQTLDSILVGPVPSGRHMFVFEAAPPDPAKIPGNDVIGVTAVIMTCSYRNREFVRVGYYVNNDYTDPELKENPPSSPLYDKLQRDIFATKPIVTRFKIDWDDTSIAGPDAVQVIESSDTNSSRHSAGTDSNLNFPMKSDPIPPSVTSLQGQVAVGPATVNGCSQNGTNGVHYEDSNSIMDIA